jgi:sigma-E factor negative regulatory protein RseA
VNENEVESQLSAMFDGELPAAECELLSRRIDRDENLRARWSRYALMGAAMRSEPVATARRGFAVRVSAALEAAAVPQRTPRGRSLVWSAALAATLVAAVAGLSVSMLRDAALGASGAPMLGASVLQTRAPTEYSASPAPAVAQAIAASGAGDAPLVAALQIASHGPLRYVTPAGTLNAPTILRTQLADYIVAHSAYSTPLLRRNVLSELVTSEDQMGIASSYTGAAGAAQGTLAGGGDAIRSTSDSSR